MGWFRKKKKKIPYTPQGRIGYKRYNTYPYNFVVIVEQLVIINEACKFRILEVSIDRDCTRTKEQCLNKWGVPDWMGLNHFTWETDEQWADRLGQPIPETYEMDEEELEEEIKYRLTPHNFINNEQ